MKTWKTWILCIACLALAVSLIGANHFGKPKTLVHVVTVKWKDGTTDAQKKAVLEGVEKMAGENSRIKKVWVKKNKWSASGSTTHLRSEIESKHPLGPHARHTA